jgi:hypothetical protein
VTEVEFRGQPTMGALRRAGVTLYRLDPRLRWRRILIALGRTLVVTAVVTSVLAWWTDPGAEPGLGGFLHAEGLGLVFVPVWIVFELSPFTPLGLSLVGWRSTRSTPDTSRFSDEVTVIKALGGPAEVQPWDRWEYWAGTADGVVLVTTRERKLCPQVLPRADLQQPDQWQDFTACSKDGYPGTPATIDRSPASTAREGRRRAPYLGSTCGDVTHRALRHRDGTRHNAAASTVRSSVRGAINGCGTAALPPRRRVQ